MGLRPISFNKVGEVFGDGEVVCGGLVNHCVFDVGGDLDGEGDFGSGCGTLGWPSGFGLDEIFHGVLLDRLMRFQYTHRCVSPGGSHWGGCVAAEAGRVPPPLR